MQNAIAMTADLRYDIDIAKSAVDCIKSELERNLQTKARKCQAIDTKPLVEPLAMWDSLTVQEKHDVAAEMMEEFFISHQSEDIEIKFGV